tara:strand:+ start:238 stop:441 length:204 start_codon:yes stop_codon:yes gene_type:complete
MALIIGLVFFFAVGYFAYNIGQCVAKFSRLNKIINQKIFGVGFLGFYIYFVVTNQQAIVDAFMAPLR